MSNISNNNNKDNATAGQRAFASALTFGVELEFMAFVPKLTIMQYHSAEEYLRSVLCNARVKLPCTKPGCEAKEHEWYLPIHSEFGDRSPDFWNLDFDMTIMLPRSDTNQATSELVESNYGNLELRSRVQKFWGSSPCPFNQHYPCTGEPFEWTWRDELKCFLQVIQEAFSPRGFRTILNETAGLHVHIGQEDLGLPLEVVQGLVGTMTALERCFDRVLPTHRITGTTRNAFAAHPEPLPGLEIDGFHSLYKPGTNKADQDFETKFHPAATRTMFKHVHDCIYDEATGIDSHVPQNSPTGSAVSARLSAKAAKSIEKYLVSFNVPGWLEIIKSKSTVDEIKSMGFADKYTALSLRGLGDSFDNGSPPTAEVRIHDASLDLNEISAWIDLLCSLTCWSEAIPKKEVFAYLLKSWRDPKYTIVRLAREVGATDATVAHYDFVMDPSYRQRRFEKNTECEADNNVVNLLIINEEKRREAFSRENVDEKIRWKLESGRYGQVPTAFLEAQPEPEIFTRPEAKFLHLNEESQKDWIEYMKNFYRVERMIELTSEEDSDADDSNISPLVSQAGDSDVLSGSSNTTEKSVVSSEGLDGGVKVDVDAESVAAGASDSDAESVVSSSIEESDDKSESDAESEAIGASQEPVFSSSEESSETSGIHSALSPSAKEAEATKATEVTKDTEAAATPVKETDAAEAPAKETMLRGLWDLLPTWRSTVESSTVKETEAETSPVKEPAAPSSSVKVKSPAKVESPVKKTAAHVLEDDSNNEGWYGIHPSLFAAYDSIPGNHLTHLEKTIISMPDLPQPPSPDMVAFAELKADTCTRLNDNFFSKITPETIANAESRDVAERQIAEFVEAEKQMYVLRSCIGESAAAERYYAKKKAEGSK
ncbi:hypothetical protein E4T42_07966 [Aureobasidium subglaciale]|nr:hypothetical protein E4T42_07966 [Aureobasidium subglaciale]